MMQRVVRVLIANKGMGNWLMMQKSYKYPLSRIVLKNPSLVNAANAFMIR